MTWMQNQRRTLNNRREVDAMDFECDGIAYTAHVGKFDDGQVAEIFVTSKKTGTHVDTAARESSTVLSMALQYGAEFEAIRRALPRDPQGQATGPLGAIMDILHEKDAS